VTSGGQVISSMLQVVSSSFKWFQAESSGFKQNQEGQDIIF
jgi:hypothetical protein